jgi:hypothetical protein
MRVCSSALEEVSWLGVVGRRHLPDPVWASGVNVVGLAAHSCGGSAGLITGFPVLKLSIKYWIGPALASAGEAVPILPPPPA